MIAIKLTPSPSPLECEQIRQLVGFYHGIASCNQSGVIIIQPKETFNFDGLVLTLQSLHFTVKNIAN